MLETLKGDFFSDHFSAEVIQNILRLQGPILVIGASGFIGFNLFAKLSKYRDDVYGTTTQVNGSWRFSSLPKNILSTQIVELDVTNKFSVRKTLAGIKPKTIFNLSAYGAYERQSDAERIHTVNYLGNLFLIESLMDLGCKAYINAGSSSEYGLNCTKPKETDVLQPNSDYSVSKGAASLMIHYYGKIKNFPCAQLRLYSVYGPWEERDRLIPRLIEKGRQKKFPPFAEPSISRDFVYVDDVLEAFLQTALTVCQDDAGISLNIGSGIQTTLLQVANESRKLFKISDEAKFGSMQNRKWDLSNWYGDASAAETKIQWKARTHFPQGLEHTFIWEEQASKNITFANPFIEEKKISAIIACYKDNEAIPVMHRRLTDVFQKMKINYEIIFVNDGSPNNDEEVIQKISSQDSQVLGISHSRNFGSQAAFMSGLEVCKGDAAIFFDGDLQDPPELIPELFNKWEQGFDVVYGQRVKRQAPLHMQFFYKLFYRIFRSMAQIQIPVDAGDFSLIDRKVIDRILDMKERDIFIRGLRAWVGFKQTGVPYVRPERMFGKTTNNFSKNIWWAKKAIFSFSTKPLDFIQHLGIGIFIIDLVLMSYYLINYFLNPTQNPKGVNTIILLVLGLGSIQLLSVSLIGDYLGKVLEEVKGRPRYIRSKIIVFGNKIERHEEMLEFFKQRS